MIARLRKHGPLDALFWIPVISGLAVFGVAAGIWMSAGGGFPAVAGDLYAPEVPTDGDRLRVVSAALTTRFLWTSAELVLAMFLVGTVVFGVLLVSSQLRGKVEWWWVAFVLGVPFIVACAVGRYRMTKDYGVARHFLVPAFEKIDCLEAQAFTDEPLAKVKEWTSFTKLTDALAAGAIVLVVFAFGALLHDLSSASLHELGRRRRNAAQLLYLSAGLLVGSLTQLLVLLSWPVAYFPDQQGAAARNFQMMAGGLTMMVGIFFTVLLFALAAPVLAVIDLQARKRVEGAPGPKTESAIKDLLTEHGLGFPVWGRAANIIAILGPAIAGILGSPAVGLFTRLLSAAT